MVAIAEFERPVVDDRPRHAFEGPEMTRLFWFLDALRAVHGGGACLTEEGAQYLGVPFSFPVPADEVVVGP